MLKQPLLNKILKLFWFGILSASILSNPLTAYPGRDSGIFLYIGALILKGRIPYRDVWENKGPLVFYINALGLFLTGGSRWGIWLLEFTFFLAASIIGYVTIKRMLGVIPALIGTFMWVSAAGNVLQGGNFSEEYSLLFSFVAIWLFLNSMEQPQNKFFNLLIGVTLGFNILLRPNNISIQVAIVGAYFILALFSRDWWLLVQRAAQIVIGMLSVLIPVLLYFAAHAALTEMINVVIVFNTQYSEGGGLARSVAGIANAARGIGFPLTAVALLGYILALIFLFKKDSFNTPRGNFLLVILIGLPLEAFLSGLSGRNYPHYFIGWALYVGILWSYVFYIFITQFVPNAARFSTPLVLILIIAVFITRVDAWKNYVAGLTQLAAQNTRLEYRDPVADYIQQNTAPEDKVLVWGFRPIINFVSERESPASYLPYPLSHVDTPLAQRWADEFYSQLTANPPALIVNMIEPADRERIPDLDPEVRKRYKIKWKDVVLAHNYKDTLDFISRNYTRIDTINGSDIYRLNTSK
jgi:hypothetical protein